VKTNTRASQKIKKVAVTNKEKHEPKIEMPELAPMEKRSLPPPQSQIAVKATLDAENEEEAQKTNVLIARQARPRKLCKSRPTLTRVAVDGAGGRCKLHYQPMYATKREGSELD